MALWGLPVGVSAQIGEAATGAAIAACGELIGAVRASPDAPPRLGDADRRTLFALALPEAAAAGPPAEIEKFEALSELSRHAGRLIRAYILAGIDGSGPLTREQREKAGRNFVEFLPEIAALYDFRLRVTARLAAGATAFTAKIPPGSAKDPEMHPGLTAIETESTTILAAVLSLVADRNIEDRWRLERMQTLARATPSFAGFLATKPAQKLADQALAAAIVEDNPAIGRLLKDFALGILR